MLIIIEGVMEINSYTIDTFEQRKFINAPQADKKDSYTVDNTKKSLIVIPYIKHLSYKLKSILSRNSYTVIQKPCNKLSKYIKLDKDNVDKFEKSGVVYKVNCADCKMSYIGQTGRQLRLRINEHKRSVKIGDTTSALADMRIYINIK